MEDRKCYMYRAVLKTDPTRDYIGVSIHPKQRWWEHGNAARKGSPHHFACAIRKYGGIEAFDWKIIAIYRNEQIARDMEEIAVLFGGLGYYNETLRMGGGNGPIVFTETLRKKISENTKQAMARPEVKEKVAASMVARWEDPEARLSLTQHAVDRWKDPGMRKKMNDAQKAACSDPELRARLMKNWEDPEFCEKHRMSVVTTLALPEVKEARSKSQRARFERDGVSEHTRQLLSEAAIGRFPSEETRAKLSRAQKLRPPPSEETRRKLSIANTGKPARKRSPEEIASTSALNTGKKRTEQHKKNISEGRARGKAAREAAGITCSEEVSRKRLESLKMANDKQKETNAIKRAAKQAANEALGIPPKVKRRPDSPEVKATKSAAAKATWAKRRAAKEALNSPTPQESNNKENKS